MMKLFLFVCCFLPALPAQALDFDANEMLAAHNRWRSTVGAPPLTYSTELAASAQVWADNLRQNNQCRMQHSKPDGKYGENLFWASAIEWTDGKREVQRVSPGKVVDDWANERADYDYARNRCAPGRMCGHYTQVVWKTTTTVGCAVSVCGNTLEQIWVCRYLPPGNWVGKKPY